MKKLKVSIQDEHTLVLQEDGVKGDLIDLSSLHDVEIDNSTIKGVVDSIKKDVFNSEVQKVKEGLEKEYKLKAELSEEKSNSHVKDEISKKDDEIIKLKYALDNADTKQKLAVTEVVSEKDQEVNNLKNELKTKDDIIKMKDDAIAYHKDMKLKLSTKMVGETLEQHCEIEFERLRATAFQNATFGKDNDSSLGSKGDYIYREADENGTEVISIMFEMKNENDETSAKKKNEDFLKELDKDRNEKKCEYAVLVSLLEIENELYNTGIVDVSHKFSKMYVVRPQFFIPIITLLRNAAMNSLKYKTELAIVRNQNIDITTFEDDVNTWKASMFSSIKNAGNKHIEAVEQINKAIKDLEKVRDSLTLSDKHLLTAENKMDDLTIKRLTRGNPTMAAKFADLANDTNN